MTGQTDLNLVTPAVLRLSTVLSSLCLVLILAAPTLTGLLLILSPAAVTEGLGLASGDGGAAGLSFGVYERAVIVLGGLAPVAFATYGLVRARRCFRSFGRGDYFSSGVVGNLRAFAGGIALWVLAGWLSTPVMSILLTLGAEEHRVTVELNLAGFMTLFFAGIVWLIADIMRRAAAIAEENAQFV